MWVSLFLRHLTIPAPELAAVHLLSFSVLFIAWCVVFFLSGLYGRYTILFRRALPSTIFVAQLINMALAVLFFFTVPFFQITPKLVLLIYLIVSTALLFFWRVYLYPHLSVRRTLHAIAIGGGDACTELCTEVARDPFYPMHVAAIIDTSACTQAAAKEALHTALECNTIDAIVIDTTEKKSNTLLSSIYAEGSAITHYAIIDAMALYEEVFERIPLSAIDYAWCARHMAKRTHVLYDISKRVSDFLIALLAGALSLVLYPFIMLAIYIDSGAPFFITQKRVGALGREITIVKFRTMTGSDTPEGALKSSLTVTRVGAFLRRSRLDELPQLFGVLLGHLSLVGPRPEIPTLAHVYQEKVQFYTFRHMVKPGLSGWAQIRHDAHPHHGVDAQATKEKLSYDLYYVKNRSIWLDAHIIFATLKTILTKKGS